MKRVSRLAIVLITAPNAGVGRKVAGALLTDRLAACVNILTGVESHYWWEGKMDRAKEVLLVVKSSKKNLAALEKRVLAIHPYDTPEIIVLPIQSGTSRYLSWLEAALR